jgi:predicted GNAT family acetyltransferase
MNEPEVMHDKPRRVFYIPLKDKEARLRYKMRNENTIDLISTYVPEEFRGKSYAKDLVTTGLSYARENNFDVVATCPYVQSFLKRNAEEYKDLNWKISESGETKRN